MFLVDDNEVEATQPHDLREFSGGDIQETANRGLSLAQLGLEVVGLQKALQTGSQSARSPPPIKILYNIWNGQTQFGTVIEPRAGLARE